MYGQVGNRDLHPVMTTDKYDSRDLSCEVDSIDVIHCTGYITVQDFIPRNFSFSFGYICGYLTKSLIGLVYNMTIYATNDTDCLDVISTPYSECKLVMNYGTFPSVLGNENLYVFARNLGQESFPCHQHSRTFLCNLYILHCDPESKELTPPCREMCHDYMSACGHYAMTEWKYVNCDYLPSLNGVLPCLDKKVKCYDSPPIIANGKVLINDSTQRNYSAEYSCNEGFSMEGNSTIFCMYSGEW